MKGENILQVDLDMPNRTTRDYEGPSVAPRIQAVLDQALEDEGDIDIDDRYVVDLFPSALMCNDCILACSIWITVSSKHV